MYISYRCPCVRIARRGRKTRLEFHDTISNDFIDTTCLASALLNSHVLLSFFLHSQLNMLQVSSYTDQNLRNSKEESEIN